MCHAEVFMQRYRTVYKNDNIMILYKNYDNSKTVVHHSSQCFLYLCTLT